ncbi:hypothetical protein KQH54_03060 [bacterium]|nr:hypothetical protein [bacterium]
MKLSHVIVVVTFLGILSMATHTSIDSDTWWHLRAGQYMVENKELITEDVFSYTSYGKAWQYPGLWVQVMMYLLFDWFGPGGLNIWVSVSITLIFYIVWKTTSGNLLLRSLVLLLAAISSAIYWSARPYLITYLLFAICYYLLERFYLSRKPLWLLPFLMVIWVNSHGGFLAGFLLMVPYLVDVIFQWITEKNGGDTEQTKENFSRVKQLLVVFLLSFGATFISPQGAKLWLLPFSTVSRQAEQLFIAEWQSPDFHNSYMLPFALLIFLTLFVVGRSGKKAAIYELLLLGGFGLLGLISVRNIFFFAIVAPAIITRYGDQLIKEGAKLLSSTPIKLDFDRPANKISQILNVSLVLIVGFISILRIGIYLPQNKNINELSKMFPIEAVNFLLNEKPEGQMFNSYNFGGYLIWALPEYPVFVDGRADLHQDEIILTWYRIMNGSEEWRDVFDEWGIRFVMLEPGAPLISSLEDDGWKEIYRDDIAVIAQLQP